MASDLCNHGHRTFLTPFIAERFQDRLKGLTRFHNHPENMVFVIQNCRLIHTFGMKYAIDLIFTDKSGLILRTCHSVTPNSIEGCMDARHTLELAGGQLTRINIEIGNRLCPSHFFCGTGC